MTDATGKNWIVTSAVVVGGIYGILYWKGESKTPPGEFIVSWGVVFFVLALMGEASPKFGGSMALLVATGDLLTHAPALSKALGKDKPSAVTSVTTHPVPALVPQVGGHSLTP